MKRTFGIALGLLLVAASAHAQSGITAHTYRQYLAGATTPVVAPFVIQQTAVTCNVALPAPLSAHSIYFADPDNAGKDCVWTDPGTGPLFAKVFGNMEGTLTNIAGTLESPESARAPFAKPPLAPTGLVVVP